jgi:hypothetical protein
MQRLAHAHQDDVPQAAARVACGKYAAYVRDLRHDFPSREVPHETHLAGRTENASHRTSRLGAEASGETPFVFHQNCLDHLPIGKAEEILPREAIAAVNFLRLCGEIYEKSFPITYVFGDPFPQWREEIKR